MNAALLLCISLAATLLAPSVADTSSVNGTWSGSWVPAGGVRDAVTIEVKQESTGALTGRFLTPSRMDFNKASFSSTTGVVMMEAVDPKSGKLYKINGKVAGTQIKGTMAAGDVSGELVLIKWTYVPR